MMKKITLVFALIIGTTLLNAQQFYFQEDFTADDLSQFTQIDADGDGNEWFTFDSGDEQGNFITSASYQSSSVLTPDNWLITTAIDLSSASGDVTLEWKTRAQDQAWVSEEYSVYIATGNTVADFTTAGASFNETLVVSEGWLERSVNLNSFIGQTVYVAFRHHDSEDWFRMNLDDIFVSSPFTDDALVTAISSPVTSGCSLGTETISVSIENAGVNGFDTIEVGYIVTDIAGTLIDSVVQEFYLDSVIEMGVVYDLTFDTLTSDLAVEGLYFVDVFTLLGNEANTSNDSLLNTIITSVDELTVPYLTSFEVLDDAGTSIPDVTAWAWTDENAIGLTSFVPTRLGSVNAGFYSEGVGSLFYDATFVGNSDTWAFSPCIGLIAQAYRIEFKVRNWTDNTGAGYVEKIQVGYGMGANTAAMTVIDSIELGDNDDNFTSYAFDFLAPSAGTYNLGIRKLTDAGFWLAVDEFSITELTAPTASINTADINTCDGSTTLEFMAETGNDYYINWGDGTIDTVTASPAMHTYTATGTQSISMTAENVAGTSTPVTVSVDNTLAAPDATFTYNQSGTGDVSVTFGASTISTCATYTWDFGGGNTATGSSTSYEFTANGTYPVIMYAVNTTGSESTTQDVIITGIGTGIEDMDFVNGINVFPNPATDILNVAFELNSNQDVDMTLVAIDGRIVDSKSIANTSTVSTTFNTSALAKGMYMLNITTTEGKFTSNVMVK